MKQKPISSIEEVVKPIIENLGLIYVDADFKKLAGGLTLTVYIDSENGVTLEDCEKVSKAIDEPIDILNPTFDKSYNLNVSSPGLDRPIKNEYDFNRAMNKEVEVKLFAPLPSGKKHLIGTLTEYDADNFVITINNEAITIKRKDAALITLHINI